MTNIITRIIHYCWFGENELPEFAKENIKTWQKFFPDYEIKQWNQHNFDIHECLYIEEAYKAKKYAFVSDYVRYKVLYEYGGLYFDVDVKVIKSFDDIIKKGSFMGMKNCNSKSGVYVAPGLCMGAVAKHPFYKEIIDNYLNLHFKNSDGTMNLKLIGEYTTEHLKKYGLRDSNEIQTIFGINLYPSDYFDPTYNRTTKEFALSENTRSIHFYAESWKK